MKTNRHYGGIDISDLVMNRVNAKYLTKLAEFRTMYSTRHLSTVMDSDIPRYGLSISMDCLKEVRIYRYLLESVMDRYRLENF